jgi:hypothetical protein
MCVYQRFKVGTVTILTKPPLDVKNFAFIKRSVGSRAGDGSRQQYKGCTKQGQARCLPNAFWAGTR